MIGRVKQRKVRENLGKTSSRVGSAVVLKRTVLVFSGSITILLTSRESETQYTRRKLNQVV